MERPYVRVNAKNEMDRLMQHLNHMMPKFMQIEGLEGITLNGGLSRGFGDKLSEIDLTIFLSPETFNKWKKGKAPIPEGIAKFDAVLYDIKITNCEAEACKTYEDVALWDMSYAKILYDPLGKIKALYKSKLTGERDIDQAGEFLWPTYWNFKLAGDIWIHREDPLQGHLMLNEAIMPLVKSVFVANKEYIPHEKWLIHMSYTLNWTPLNWIERLKKAMSTNDFTLESLIQRQGAIKSLYEEIDQYIRQNYYDGFELACHQKWCYDLLKVLAEREAMPLDEWRTFASVADLNTDPLYHITEIRDGFVYLNKDKLAAMTENDMYAWHFEIVKKMQEELTNSQ